MDLQSSLNITLSFTQVLAWPALVGIVLIAFRKELQKLLQNVESAKGFGIETTFFQEALEDPEASDETKDVIARLWRDVEATRGNPAPAPAEDHLEKRHRERGRPVRGKIAEAVNQQTYQDQVRTALDRVGGDKVRVDGAGVFPFTNSKNVSGHWANATAQLKPRHGVGLINVIASLTREGSRADELAGTPTNGILIVAPFELEIAGVESATWACQADDEALADCLERLGAFDYVDGPGAAT